MRLWPDPVDHGGNGHSQDEDDKQGWQPVVLNVPYWECPTKDNDGFGVGATHEAKAPESKGCDHEAKAPGDHKKGGGALVAVDDEATQG